MQDSGTTTLEQMQDTNSNICSCWLCEEHRAFDRIISKLSGEDIEWMRAFYERVDNERFDADINAAILDGSWPPADQYLTEGLRLHKEKYGNG